MFGPKQFNANDRYLLVSHPSGKEVETQPSLAKAQHAAEVLDNHNIKHGHEGRIRIIDRTTWETTND